MTLAEYDAAMARVMDLWRRARALEEEYERIEIGTIADAGIAFTLRPGSMSCWRHDELPDQWFDSPRDVMAALEAKRKQPQGT